GHAAPRHDPRSGRGFRSSELSGRASDVPPRALPAAPSPGVTGATIYLVRHGETEWNRIRRYQGWSDSPLTDQGGAQAKAIGRLLSKLPEIGSADLVASPIGRARHTAEIIRECLGRREPLRFAGLPRAAAMRLPVPQDRLFRLAAGAIEEIAVT